MRNRLLPLVLLLCLPGCDSADNPAAPSGSSLAVSANPTKISLTGSSDITITGFRPDGNPLSPGTQIRLSTDVGRMEATIVEVGAGGVATGKLLADGASGMATVSAGLTSGTGEAATTTVDINELKPTLLISANPTSINVLETSTVTITARDENSFPLGAGNEIFLAANFGRTLVNNREVSSVSTNDDGRAQVIFQAGEQAGAGSVTAFLANSDEVEVPIEVRDAAASFSFNVNKTEVDSGGDSLILTATVVNSDGVALGGVLVRFESTIGGVFNPSDAVTTVSTGQAETTLELADAILESGAAFSVSAIVRIGEADQRLSRTIMVR